MPKMMLFHKNKDVLHYLSPSINFVIEKYGLDGEVLRVNGTASNYIGQNCYGAWWFLKYA